MEKYPALCNPLVLFGGLITIPFWGLRNISIAMADILIADLPHVEYDTDDKEKKVNQNEVDEAVARTEELNKKLKSGGFPFSQGKEISINDYINGGG